ncbi:MAG: hypothetical protein KC457_06095 [Myxococcales bacterium]|nr:hypothetical protein [Myxococcales bacterium]
MSAPGSRPHRRLTLGVTALFVLAGVGPSLGCRNRKNLAEHVMDDPASELSSARCGGDGQIVRPLIIEWPATDRASLEGRLQRGLVVVRYQGCVVEVLRECAAPVADSGYEYLGITRKLDSIAIRSSDELYANMPLTAVKLEAKLAKAGEAQTAALRKAAGRNQELPIQVRKRRSASAASMRAGSRACGVGRGSSGTCSSRAKVPQNRQAAPSRPASQTTAPPQAAQRRSSLMAALPGPTTAGRSARPARGQRRSPGPACAWTAAPDP